MFMTMKITLIAAVCIANTLQYLSTTNQCPVSGGGAEADVLDALVLAPHRRD